MTNLQGNPGTPPPPTPSNSSTRPPPSTSPKPRLRRVKMLARKIVASGVLRKKLSEKLKASQDQNSDSNSDSESYKSARVEQERVEESDKKSGGSGSSEAAKGLEKGRLGCSEAVEVEEMEQVHQEEVQPLEVQTPKTKKLKTSSKKSSSVFEAVEASLAKRTRKKGRLLKDLEDPGMMRLVDALAAQGWKDMVLQMNGRLARNEIFKFMANAEVQNGKMAGKDQGNNDPTDFQGGEKARKGKRRTPGLSSQGYRTICPTYSPAASQLRGSQPSTSHGSHPSMSQPYGSQPLRSQPSISQPLGVHPAMSQSQRSQPSSSSTPSIPGLRLRGSSSDPPKSSTHASDIHVSHDDDEEEVHYDRYGRIVIVLEGDG
uniref:Uncharacterized protein LOC104235223 n=1 Tax=Nicotiana sylvestris TaxID=4096 RepID=A0A1U7X8Q8_NICSY|nr:PREDICTED: uncharacterized protein LOC104235223 [Nicotiana sylvestris]